MVNKLEYRLKERVKTAYAEQKKFQTEEDFTNVVVNTQEKESKFEVILWITIFWLRYHKNTTVYARSKYK